MLEYVAQPVLDPRYGSFSQSSGTEAVRAWARSRFFTSATHGEDWESGSTITIKITIKITIRLRYLTTRAVAPGIRLGTCRRFARMPG